MTLGAALVGAAVSVGAVHTAAPDRGSPAHRPAFCAAERGKWHPVIYEAATITAMVLLVVPARAAAAAVRGAWAERYGDALAGCVVALVGLAVVGLRI